MIRPQVQQLTQMGPLPDSETATDELLDGYMELFEAISLPVTDEEAEALASLFGSDDCFGMAWILVEMIETAPSWTLKECNINEQNEWRIMLRHRAEGAAITNPENLTSA